MESKRLKYRLRTNALITEVLNSSIEDQLHFFGFETEQELEHKLVRIEKSLSNHYVDYRIFDMIEKQSNQVIGSCGFHNWVSDQQRAEIGYTLHEKYRGHWYLTEAVGLINLYGFKEMQLNRIEALTDPKNNKSLSIINKFKLQKEGLLRAHYKEAKGFTDSLVFSLLKSEYYV